MSSKLWVIAILMALSLIAGAASQHLFPGVDRPPTDWWLLPLFAFLIFLWYRLDSIQRSYRRSPWLNICVIGIAILALPYYFFRSRGFKGGAIASIAMLGLLLLSSALTVLGAFIVYYGLQS